MKFDANGWLDEAIEIPVLQNSMSRNGLRITHITMHGTAGGSSAQNIGYYFQSTQGTNNPASTHFVIGKDGVIVQCIPVSLAAWGNGSLNNPRISFPAGTNPNLYTISIEHVKQRIDNSDEITPAQMLASCHLTKTICDTYGIPARKGDAVGGIVSHADFDSVNRSRCPGPYPWDQLWNFLKQGERKEDMPLDIKHPFASAYFQDLGGGKWKCKTNGIEVFGAIGSYWRTIQGAPRLPITGEQYNIPGVVWQAFEGGIIVYNPQNKIIGPMGMGNCFMAHKDDPIFKTFFFKPLQDQLAQYLNERNELTKTCADLKAKLAQAEQAAPHAVEMHTALREINQRATEHPIVQIKQLSDPFKQ